VNADVPRRISGSEVIGRILQQEMLKIYFAELVRIHLSDYLVDLSKQNLDLISQSVQPNGHGAPATLKIMDALAVVLAIVVFIKRKVVKD
jgi:hypothetical protein